MIGISVNDFGTPVSLHTCEACGREFTVCPARENDVDWGGCLARECPSYDPARDVDRFFGPDAEPGVIREPIEQIRELPGA